MNIRYLCMYYYILDHVENIERKGKGTYCWRRMQLFYFMTSRKKNESEIVQGIIMIR